MESSLHVFCVPGQTDITSSLPCHHSICCVSRSSPSTKTDGVTAEDNPYGVSLGLPCEVPAVTKSTPDPPPESVYEPVPH